MTKKSQKINEAIFLAFVGQPIKQRDAVFKIKNGYECWNLNKLSRDEFIEAIKKKIAPVNKNVLKNYQIEKQYEESSWGLLIPDRPNDVLTDSYAETISLLNLYSSEFLYPIFYISRLGAVRPPSQSRFGVRSRHTQNQSHIFKKEKFASFFKTLLPQARYGNWQSDRVEKWGLEDWRLFVANSLFSGLIQYDGIKNIFGWQRESADLAVILEALFTAGDSQNEEIGYRLRKRVAVLLSWKIENIEAEVKDLYSERSAFVHGSFFAQIAKDSRRNNNQLPSVNFSRLHDQKEFVRLALVAYLHLARLIEEKPAEYMDPSTGKNPTTMSVLERAIIDIKLRNKIVKETRALFFLMP